MSIPERAARRAERSERPRSEWHVVIWLFAVVVPAVSLDFAWRIFGESRGNWLATKARGADADALYGDVFDFDFRPVIVVAIGAGAVLVATLQVLRRRAARFATARAWLYGAAMGLGCFAAATSLPLLPSALMFFFVGLMGAAKGFFHFLRTAEVGRMAYGLFVLAIAAYAPLVNVVVLALARTRLLEDRRDTASSSSPPRFAMSWEVSAAIVFVTFVAIDVKSSGQRNLATDIALAAVAAIWIRRIAHGATATCFARRARHDAPQGPT